MEGGDHSRLRGVVQLRAGRWGARVIVDKKQIWLGTFDSKEDAATAYDRVNLKLKRLLSLNFPLAFRTLRERRFQDMYPLESIITMIKEGTYDSMYSSFESHETSLAGMQFLGGDGGVGSQAEDSALEARKPVMLFGARIG